MISKVVIAAAGKGTRMLDLAKDRPKHIIPVAGKPFLYYLLANLKAAGLEDIVLVVGHHKEKIIEFVDSVKSDFSITIVDQFEQLGSGRYGSACPIEAAEPVIGDSQFIAVYGDNLFSIEDLNAIRQDDEHHYIAGLIHEEPERYGVLITDGSKLARIEEKPAEPIPGHNMINSGLYKFTSDIFPVIKSLSISPRGEYELTDAVSHQAQLGKVKVMPMKDYWYDFGRPEDIEIIENFLKKH